MPAADPRERRTVTVLFSDLSGFTRLSASLDPEEAADLVDALFLRLRGVIEAHGGTVDKFIGDAVMAVFGAPVARGDDAARAVRAALAMQREVGAFAREKGRELRLRVGLNTGEVLWGGIGGDRATAMGDAVNVAQRMEAAAEPGTVLLSRATERAARGAVRTVSAGAIRVKGRDEPVEAAVALEELEGATEFREAKGSSFAGRTAELARIADACGPGRRAFLVVEGDAGIGKSRLLHEARKAVRARGGTWVAAGRCLEGVRLPLAPFAEIVRGEAGGAAVPPERIAAALADAMRAGVPSAVERENFAHLIAASVGAPVPGARVAGLDPARLVAETRHAWARWLSCRAPALLCVEDLHWAGEDTRGLLEALARESQGVTIVATTRPGAALPAGFEKLPLGEVAGEAALAIAAGALGAPPSPELAAFLLDRTGGHPLWLEELGRHLREGGFVEGRPARLAAAPDRLPDSLQGVLVARLDALPSSVKETLKAASVFGRAFWPSLLAAITGNDPADALAAAERASFVVPRADSLLPGEPESLFRHMLLRDAAYSLLTKKDRARLHAAAADLLQARAAGARRVLALAAAQREAAGQAPEAAALWHAVARDALDAFGWEEAQAAARHAAALGEPAARLLAARALGRLGRLDEALAEAGAAREAGLGDRADFARAGVLVQKGESASALALYEAVAASTRDPRLRVEALARRVNALEGLTRRREALAASREARTALAELPPGPDRDLEVLRAALDKTESHVLWNLGSHPEARDAAFRAVDTWRALGERALLADGLTWAAAIHTMASRPDDAGTCLREAIAIHRELGDRLGLGKSLQIETRWHWSAGRAAEARASNAESLALLRAIGDPQPVASGLHLEANILLHEGKLREALAAGEEALRTLPHGTARHTTAIVLDSHGVVLAELGRFEESVAALERARDLNREIGQRWNEGVSWLDLVWALSVAGRSADAARTATEAIERFGDGAATDAMTDLYAERALARLEAGLPGVDEDLAAAAGEAREAPRSPSLVLHVAAARRALARGRLPEAREALAALRVSIGARPPWRWRMELLELESRISLGSGDAAAGARLAAEGSRQATDAGSSMRERRFRALLTLADAPRP